MVLRNVVPRQGTETFQPILSDCILRSLLRNVVPRQGTETSDFDIPYDIPVIAVLRNVVPRQGTETLC